MATVTSYTHTRQLEKDGHIHSPKLVNTPRALQVLSVWLVAIVGASIFLLGFLPWQQTVTGVGEVTTIDPMSRPQTVEAPIDARIEQWLVKEGDWVEKDQPILLLSEIKNYYLDENQLERMLSQREAKQYEITATESTMDALQEQLSAVENSRGFVVPGAQAKRSQALAKFTSAQQKLMATQQNLQTAVLYENRISLLFDEGLKSQRELEVAVNKLAKAKADKASAEADVQGAQQAINEAEFDVGKSGIDIDAKSGETRAKLAKGQQDYAKATADLLKLDNEIQNLQARQEQRIIRAPIDGRMARASVYGSGQTVKEGGELCVIAPKETSRAVALFLTDVDAPLVSVGRAVRLQFAGFPAVQFSGWPNAAVGTFAGRVSVIDAVDDGKNRFRILVVPDQAAIDSKKEQDWPTSDYLRFGTQALGWVILEQVPVGFELWRRFNGFQLNLKEAPMLNTAVDQSKGYKDATSREEKANQGGSKFGGIKSNATKQK